MRKLYTLIAGLILSMAVLKTTGQQLSIYHLSGFIGTEKTGTTTIESAATCSANFEITNTSVSILAKKFTAIPNHSEQNRPAYICWSFGDGKDTCVQYANTSPGTYTVGHNYLQPGVYEVCVKIVYAGGCEAKFCKQLTIPRPDECKADFEKLASRPNSSGQGVYLKALPSHNNNKKPSKICWIFGDGKDTCITYPENYTGDYKVHHFYTQPGQYQVCMYIGYFGGCESKNCKAILVEGRDECKTDFERLQPTAANSPLTAVLKALPWNSNNRKPKTICWRFGDGKDTCITYPENFTGTYSVSHTYHQPGSFEVCMKTVYYGGCEAYQCKPIILNRPDECKVDFEKYPVSSGINPYLVYYKAIPAHNNNKKPKQVCWKFGDGKDTCITYPENFTGAYVISHVYPDQGFKEVCVRILYYGGCEAKSCKMIQVGHSTECKADFERLPVTTNSGLYVSLKALPSHIGNKKPKTVCWSFGDRKDTCITYPENYTGNYSLGHQYKEPGNYEVCVKILYYGGCEAKKCSMIKVERPDECRVKISEIIPSLTSLVRGFYASPWSSNNKKILRLCFGFGDGTDTCVDMNAATNPNQLFIRHAYPAPGVYKACVKVMFDGGCSSYDCTEVIIRAGSNACGGYMTDSMISPRTFKFRGTAIHNPADPVVDFQWTFGDGSSASGNEVTHTYNTIGTYEACLQIRTHRGCVTKICKKIYVPGNTQAMLQISPNPVVSVAHVKFYSTHNETVTIKIVNASGIVVKSYSRNAVVGANAWDLDLNTLVPGSYMLYIQSPNQLSSQLFIKQ
jgi:PKD repeat protein